MVTIRTYHDSDFEAILQLLQNSLQFDSITRELLNEKIYDDPFFDAGTVLVATQNEQVTGFMMGVHRNIRQRKFGYIKLMAVSPEHRRKGIASQMYLKLQKLFFQQGCEVVRIMDVPMNYYMPGIDPAYTPAVCFAQKHGFVRNGESCNMTVDLLHQSWETAEEENSLEKNDVQIQRANETDLDSLMDFLTPEWELWQYEVKMAMKRRPCCVFIAKNNDAITGFAAYNGNNAGTGWFGPMGTHTDMRGMGIGKILLYRCLKDMKSAGLTNSTIPWVAPVCFYARHANAQVTRTFWRYEKLLYNG